MFWINNAARTGVGPNWTPPRNSQGALWQGENSTLNFHAAPVIPLVDFVINRGAIINLAPKNTAPRHVRVPKVAKWMRCAFMNYLECDSWCFPSRSANANSGVLGVNLCLHLPQLRAFARRVCCYYISSSIIIPAFRFIWKTARANNARKDCANTIFEWGVLRRRWLHY